MLFRNLSYDDNLTDPFFLKGHPHSITGFGADSHRMSLGASSVSWQIVEHQSRNLGTPRFWLLPNRRCEAGKMGSFGQNIQWWDPNVMQTPWFSTVIVIVEVFYPTTCFFYIITCVRFTLRNMINKQTTTYSSPSFPSLHLSLQCLKHKEGDRPIIAVHNLTRFRMKQLECKFWQKATN